MKQVTARAHTNIALIKYWGKEDEQLFLPMNSSLSLTLEAFYTDTQVKLLTDRQEDRFILNQQEQSVAETKKITAFIDLFRKEAQIEQGIEVNSYNHVPTAAGLASSASAFAALGAGLNRLLELDYETQKLSTFVRQGSGSATRSVYGGFVEWQKGTTTDNSYATQIDSADWDIGMVTVALNTQQKSLSSRKGMKHTLATSDFYSAWVQSAEADLTAMKKAIAQQDFQTLGEITEHSGMKMHATMLAAKPPFTYFEPLSLSVMEKVRALRKAGLQAYFTMDAGPNVKILCRYSEAEQIKKELEKVFPKLAVIVSAVGPGVQILNEI